MSSQPPSETASHEEDRLGAMLDRLQADDLDGLEKLLKETPPADIAAVVEEVDDADQLRLFRLLDTETQAEVLDELPEEEVRHLVEAMPMGLQAAVEMLEPDEVADVLDALPDEQAEAMLERFPAEQAAAAEHLRTYSGDTAGGLMTTEFILLQDELTAREAVQITQASRETETVAHLFVADSENRLVGLLPLAKLVFARPDRKVGSLMEDLSVVASVDTDQEELVRAATRYDLDVVPVTDKQGHMVGVVTVDDILEAAEQEVDEDMYAMAGTRERDPVHASISLSTRLRLPWLLLSVLDGMFIAFVVSRFSGTLNMMQELSFFIPLIPLMGGQVAIQASTIMVRAMAVGDIHSGMLVRYMRKQSAITLLLALACGVAVVLLGMAVVGVGPQVMLAVGMAVCIAILFAGTFGMIFPLVFNAVGIDPAVSSGPFITMLNDLFCISIYLLLGMLLAPAA